MAAFCNQVFETDPRRQSTSSTERSPPDINILDEPVVSSPTTEHTPHLPSQPPTPITAVPSPTAPSSQDVERLDRTRSLDTNDKPAQPLRKRMSRLSLSSSLASLSLRSRSSHPRRSSDPRSPQDTQDSIPPLPSSPTANGSRHFPPPTVPLAAPGKKPSEDVAGPRHKRSAPHASTDILAGDPTVYMQSNWPSPPAAMIRERVGTNGVVRPLEPQSELSAFSITEEQVGVVPEAALARYIEGKKKLDTKYAREMRRIARKRVKIAKEVPEASAAHMARLQHHLERHSGDHGRRKGKGQDKGDGGQGGALNAAVLGANWSLAWALDSDEHPPPSSIVARRDTSEARALALIADQAVIAEPSRMNANSLWSATLQLFTADANRGGNSGEKRSEDGEEPDGAGKKERRKKRESIVGHHFAPGGEPKSKRRTGSVFWRLRTVKDKQEA